jgi:putative ABC transport system substrate-binding protein
MFTCKTYVEAGGLMSYGADYVAMHRRLADLAGKILEGTKPADIPVEQPSKFEFVINLKTVKALDLYDTGQNADLRRRMIANKSFIVYCTSP